MPMSLTPSVKVPAGMIVPEAQRCFLHVGDRVEMVDLDSGRTLDRVTCDAEPVAADERHVVAATLPTASDGGRLIDLTFAGSTLEVRGEHPLLASGDVTEATAFFERAELRTELTDTVATVVVDVHNRYTGAAPPDDELLERARFVHRTTVRLDLSSGEIIERTSERLPRSAEVPAPHDQSPSEDAAENAARDLVTPLPPGSTPVAAIDRRIVYETVELDPERAVEQRYLNVLDQGTTAPAWRRLIDEVRHAPPPPPPP